MRLPASLRPPTLAPRPATPTRACMSHSTSSNSATEATRLLDAASLINRLAKEKIAAHRATPSLALPTRQRASPPRACPRAAILLRNSEASPMSRPKQKRNLLQVARSAARRNPALHPAKTQRGSEADSKQARVIACCRPERHHHCGDHEGDRRHRVPQPSRSRKARFQAVVVEKLGTNGSSQQRSAEPETIAGPGLAARTPVPDRRPAVARAQPRAATQAC